MLKIPISGGPHTGKTTLLEALKSEYPGAYFVEEPAERVISEELRKEEEGQSYKGIYPWDNYPSFARLAIDRSLELEAAISESADIVFQDRSIIDNIGYGALNNFVELEEEIERHIAAANYGVALFCEPVGEYTTTLIRRETPEKAQQTHEALSKAYDESGIAVVHLPAISVPDRLRLVDEALAVHL